MNYDRNTYLPSSGLQTDAKPFGVRFETPESGRAVNHENSAEECDDHRADRNSSHFDTELPNSSETSESSRTKEKKNSEKKCGTDSKNFNKSYLDSRQSATHQPEYTVNNISIVNSQNFQVGHKYYVKKQSKKCDKIEKDESPKNIPVRKGIFESKRDITTEDMYCVAEQIGQDWRHLARFLPGNKFHNGRLDALDYNHRGNLLEIVYNMLREWKEECPEEATVGNLASTLWKTNHPDIVTHLKP